MLSYPSVYLRRMSTRHALNSLKAQLPSVGTTSRKRKHRKSKSGRHKHEVFLVDKPKVIIDVLHYFDSSRDVEIKLQAVRPIMELIISHLSEESVPKSDVSSSNSVPLNDNERETAQNLKTLQAINSSITSTTEGATLNEGAKKILGQEIVNYIEVACETQKIVEFLKLLRELDLKTFDGIHYRKRVK